MYYIEDEAFETEEDAYLSFSNTFDFTDELNLDRLCEKMGSTKEELLGTLLSLALRGKTIDHLDFILLDAIGELFKEDLVIDEEDEDEEEDDKEDE